MRFLSTRNGLSPWQRRGLANDWMGDVFGDFDRMVDTFLSERGSSGDWSQPHFNSKETETHFLLSFDFPGVKKEDLKVEVKNNILSVAGERKDRSDKGEGFGRYFQSVTLPPTVDADKIEAAYEDGVLKIALPKAEKAQGRTIEIQSGETNLFGRFIGNLKS